MKIAKIGIDEAGRGCVMGSLFISAVSVTNEEVLDNFKDIGVRDSKQILKAKRNELRKIINDCSDVFSCSVSPIEIDNDNLNSLTFNKFVYLINTALEQLKFGWEFFHDEDSFVEIYIDCPISNTIKYKNMLFKQVHYRQNVKIISENKADDKYVVVGAASVMAKTERDYHMDCIRDKYEEYGDIGSGYPSDTRTSEFLKNYYFKTKSFPKEVRNKWGTISNIRREIDAKGRL